MQNRFAKLQSLERGHLAADGERCGVPARFTPPLAALGSSRPGLRRRVPKLIDTSTCKGCKTEWLCRSARASSSTETMHGKSVQF